MSESGSRGRTGCSLGAVSRYPSRFYKLSGAVPVAMLPILNSRRGGRDCMVSRSIYSYGCSACNCGCQSCHRLLAVLDLDEIPEISSQRGTKVLSRNGHRDVMKCAITPRRPTVRCKMPGHVKPDIGTSAGKSKPKYRLSHTHVHWSMALQSVIRVMQRVTSTNRQSPPSAET